MKEDFSQISSCTLKTENIYQLEIRLNPFWVCFKDTHPNKNLHFDVICYHLLDLNSSQELQEEP